MSRTDSKFYNGNEHIFYSDDGSNNVYLRAGEGQTLIIDGSGSGGGGTTGIIGTDTQVAYNKSNVMVGNANLTFDDSNLSVLGSVKTPIIYGVGNTDSLGYNELYQGTAPQNVITSFTTQYRNMGKDVVVARNVNYINYACPYYLIDASQGGISIWNGSGTSFSEYTSSLLSYANYTTNAEVKFTSMNEDADIAVLAANDEQGYITTYTRSEATWSYLSTKSAYFNNIRISGSGSSCRMIFSDYNANFKVYSFNGTNWSLEQTLLTNGLGIAYNRYFPLAIDGNRLCFYYSGSVYLYAKAGATWILSSTINKTIVELDYYNNLLCLLTTSQMFIYESGTLTATFSITGGVGICNNGTQVFVLTTSGIKIYAKVIGVWTKSVNDVVLKDGYKIACNSGYVSVGRPTIGTYGSAKIYQIQVYIKSAITLNTVNLVDASSKVSISSSAGTLLNTGTLVINDATDSSSSSTGSVVLSGGLGLAKNLYTGTSINSGTSITSGTSILSGTTITSGTGLVSGTSMTVGTNLILNGSVSGNTSLKSSATTTSYTLTFPSAVGSAGQYLKTIDGSGTFGWSNESLSLYYGDGSDGDYTLSSGAYNQTKDMYYNNLTLSGSAIFSPNGFRTFVRGTLTFSSGITNGGFYAKGAFGANGSGQTGGGTGGVAQANGTLGGPISNGGAGGNGGANGTGTAGSSGSGSSTAQFGGNSPASGVGGNSGFLGGSSGGTTTNTVNSYNIRRFNTEMFMPTSNTTFMLGGQSSPGAGGGAAGALGTGGKGGGGAAGGCIAWICCKNLVVNTSYGTLIDCSGGNGGNGANGTGTNAAGGGGATGGSGGFVYLAFGSLSGSVTPSTSIIKVTGGTGGTAGSSTGTATAASAGTTGGTGAYYVLNLSSGNSATSGAFPS